VIYDIAPVPKPRMTQRDKWLNPPRKPVAKYRAFKTLCNLRKVEVPEEGAHVTFTIAMPKSWSKKKKHEMFLTKHQSRPDLDNYLKALLDACHTEDSGIWDIRVTKIWGKKGRIEII